MAVESFKCRYCEQEKPIAERNLQAGEVIAHYDCFMAFGFSPEYQSWRNRVVAYDICEACVDRFQAKFEKEEEEWLASQLKETMGEEYQEGYLDELKERKWDSEREEREEA